MSLNLYLGCMYSGKSTKCIEHYNMFENPCVINYYFDTRYDNNLLSTHDLKKIPCHRLKRLSEIYDVINGSNYILINEAQFFEDLYEVVLELVEKKNKHVYIYGLDSDFMRRPFGDIIKLIPLATSYTKLYAICETCKEQACFTHKKSGSNDQIEIGSTSIYTPVCRSCYLNLNSI